MRTSTLLAVLAALMLLVACAAPVFGQSSSSSTGESSSSSAAIIASSSSSTGTSGNNTAASSSAASASSSSSGAAGSTVGFILVFPSYTSAALNAQSNATTVIQQEIANLLSGVSTSQVSVAPGQTTKFQDYALGGTFTSVLITNAPANAIATINANKGSQAFLSQATIVDGTPQGGSASTLSFGFAAVAVVLAALLQ